MARKARRIRTAAGDTVKADAAKLNQPTSEQQFQMEYAYVIKDLRRVFILAGIMFTLLIILNIVLQ